MGIVEELPTTLEDLRCKGVTESKAPTITVSEIDEDTLPTKDVVSECKGLGKSSATTITVSEIHEDSLSVRDHVPKPEVLVVANDSVLQDASTIKFGTVLCTLVLIVFMVRSGCILEKHHSTLLTRVYTLQAAMDFVREVNHMSSE